MLSGFLTCTSGNGSSAVFDLVFLPACGYVLLGGRYFRMVHLRGFVAIRLFYLSGGIWPCTQIRGMDFDNHLGLSWEAR